MKEYMEPFWVGLMDGDGSIQVNHWRHRYLQYRLVIKLKYTPANYEMLNNISNVIGGHVKTTGNFVLWVENNVRKIQYILTIFDHYPPLTSRLQCQLVFANSCLENKQNDLDWYSLNRNLKYETNALRTAKQKKNTLFFYAKSNSTQKKTAAEKKNENKKITTAELPCDTTHVSNFVVELQLQQNAAFCLLEHRHILSVSYFHAWLSGFIEAEGCFSIRQNGNHSFSIGQNNDKYLILAIKKYFHATNMIRTPKKTAAKIQTHSSPKKKESLCSTSVYTNPFYLLEIYRKESLMQIISHCKTYPLLGQKNVQFVEFVSAFNRCFFMGKKQLAAMCYL
jgi:hypothetical protein